MFLKDEIQSIISGTRSVTKGDAIQAIANYIRKSKEPGTTIEEKEHIKEQEASAILTYSKFALQIIRLRRFYVLTRLSREKNIVIPKSEILENRWVKPMRGFLPLHK
ncbi:MAG: hypothetical protein JST10_16465 [Bacteroidetes bacterium]|nr:hypothetical protein [Bacteroidota bacterium]MBS1634157.1 hypothetical protein [Bacteroidota bacterium]